MIYARETTSTDRAIALLADSDRRTILRYLSENDGDVAHYDELVFAIAVDDYKGSDERTREKSEIRILLENRYLPILAEDGVVEFDHRSETVRYHGDAGVEALLGFLSTIE